MGLSRAAKERALQAIVGNGAYVGLAMGREGNQLQELQDVAYRRQKVTFGPAEHGQVTAIRSVSVANFPPLQFSAPADVTEWFLIDAESGGGTVLATGKIAPRGYIDIDTGQTYTFEEGAKATGNLRTYGLRPLAGEEVTLRAGEIVLYFEDVPEQ